MRPWCYVGIFGAVLAACILVLLPSHEPAALPHRTETDRIARQLARVAEAMRTSPPADLTAPQVGARAQALRWLDEYRRRRVFPHNHVLMGTRTPVFVDPHGTPCAVAYLLLRSGETELVKDVVRSANLGRVHQLAVDARLQTWLASRGIAEEEAARIQPTYGGTPHDSGMSSYVGATVGFSVLTAALGSYSLMASRPTRGLNTPRVLSVASLLGHATLVAAAVGSDHDRSQLAVVTNIVGGLISAVLVAGPFAPSGKADAANVSSFAITPLMGFEAQRVTLGATIRH